VRHPRPVVVLSKCLEVEACRYDGQIVRAPFVVQLTPYVEMNPICPEVEIGLGTPRDPIQLVTREGSQRLVQPSTDRDLTQGMGSFSDEYLGALGDVDGFILKSRSPSCGIKDTKIDSAERGPGMFGGAVLERFPHAAVEDEARLTNFRIRHHFLTKLFALASFRSVRDSGSTAALVQFHSEYKFVLMAYHQTELRALGRIVASAAKRAFGEVMADYEAHLAHALARPARSNPNVNVLMHAHGHVSDGLGGKGKQRYLEPYPADLMDSRDSGRH